MSVIDDHCKVLFVGAGPVALFTAIQAKLQDPSLNIAMVERLSAYVRSQTLSIDPASFDKVCNLKRVKQQHPEYTAQVHDFAQLLLHLKAERKIKINELEAKLRRIAEALNIVIHQGYTFQAQARSPSDRELVGAEGLKQAFPNAKVIVGSDGAHSKVREAVFNNDLTVDEGLQHTIAIKYWVKHTSTKLDAYAAYPSHKLVGFTQEHIGKYEPDKNATPITVQFFVDPATFEKFEHHRAGNPLSLEGVKAADPVFEAKVRTWLAIRHEQLGDAIEGDVDVYSIKLPVYRSREAVHQSGEQTFCLVGDALFGVPFFKSINNGLLCGSKLGKALVKTLNPSAIPKRVSVWKRTKSFIKVFFLSRIQADEGLSAAPLARYAAYTDKLATKEIQLARLKNFALDFYQWFLKISAHVPWQVNKWTRYDIQRFTEFDLSL